MDGKYYNLWSTDNARTDANDEVVIKSVYDPSPVGYSLPASNAFTGFTTTGGFSGVNATPDLLNVKGDYDEGYYCYTKPGKTGNTFFFYADGLRMHSQGNMRLIPSNGFEWTSGVLDSNTGRNFYFHIKMINPLKDYNKNFGFPVRSAEEKETHKFNIKQEMDGRYYNLWSTDNDRTDGNDDVVIKSVYDPSPVGYSIPASNAFTGFTTTGNGTNNSSEYNVNGGFNKGWHFYCKPNKKGSTVFFPACGSRYYGTGSLSNVTTYSYYWVAGPGNTNYGRYLGFGPDGVYPLNRTDRSYGFSVRSAEEKEENVTIFQHLRFVFYYIQKRTSYLSYLLYINYFVCYRFCSTVRYS